MQLKKLDLALLLTGLFIFLSPYQVAFAVNTETTQANEKIILDTNNNNKNQKTANKVNLSQLDAYLFPIPPPLHTALCFVQFLVLQAKHSSSFSQNPSRQGPSWLARHFCNNYPSALDLVLALALVALVLGVIYRGSIVLRLFNWSFDFWFACY